MTPDQQQVKMVEEEIKRRKDTQLHTCNYGCPRPVCISRQRDELRDYAMAIYRAVTDRDPSHRMTFKQVMEYASTQLKDLK
jgi:hypothetical protein